MGDHLVLISQKVREHIRDHGICTTSGDQINKELEKALELSDFNEEACEYAGMLIDFCYEQAKAVQIGQVWLGSSEIIEPLFGKLKNFEQDQSKGGFTSLVLGAAACVGKVNADIVSAAMKQIKTTDIDKWIKTQMGPTLLARRRKALGSWIKKDQFKKVAPKQARSLLGNAVGF